MDNVNNSMGCTIRCWAVAALAAALCGVLLIVLGGWGWSQAIFAAALVTLALGVLLTFIACRPLPALGTASQPGQSAPAPQSAAPATAAPAAAPGASAVKASAPLPGQAELAARKGDWKYENDDAPAAKPAKAASKASAPEADNTRKPVAAEGKPELLKQAREGGPDDLKMIKGVGPKLETLLHGMGIYHFDQIASWRAKEVQWVDENLEGFKGRVTRDDWVKQSKVLAEGGATEFSKKVKKGGVY